MSAVLLITAATLAAACRPPAEDSVGGTSAATDAMADRLAALAEEVERTDHPYAMSHTGVERESDAPAPAARVEAQALEARDALRAGRTVEGLRAVNRIFEEVTASGERLPPAVGLVVIETAALAHLRLWLEHNCAGGPEANASTCTFPDPRPTGAKDQARAAFDTYVALQDGRPDNLAIRWLLNLSAMMGEAYPEAVREDRRLPASAFSSSAGFSRFPDVASSLGVDVAGHAGGSVLDDFDRDGDLDLAVSSWHLTDPLRIFRNDGPEGFTEITEGAGIAGLTGGLHLVQADYDNDGWVDLLVLRGAWTSYGEPNSLLRNRGDGTFEDVTRRAGLLEEHPGQVGVWADADGDGWLDLFVGYESDARDPVPARLYLNGRDGTFTDVAAAAGVDVTGFVKGAAWGDVDDDGDPDLYISRLNEPNLLLRNEGPGPDGIPAFVDVTDRAGVAEPLSSFPTWFWDYDNDGALDLFVSGYRGTLADIAAEYLGRTHDGEAPRLYRNLGDGVFEDVTEAVGLDRVLLTMGSNFGDLDNDGFPDLLVGTGEANLNTIVPNRAFRNVGGLRFEEVTAAGGFGHLGKGHGVSFGDVDGDGDQDVYMTMGGAYPADVARNVLYLNPGHGHAWVRLDLEGTTSNRSAIGARIRVEVEGGRAGTRQIHEVVGTGSSFGANSLAAEVGLGSAERIVELEVRWPSGEVQSFTDLAVNRRYRLVEGRDDPVAVSGGPPPEDR